MLNLLAVYWEFLEISDIWHLSLAPIPATGLPHLYVSSMTSVGVGQKKGKWLMSVSKLSSFPEAIGDDYFPSALHRASVNFVVMK